MTIPFRHILTKPTEFILKVPNQPKHRGLSDYRKVGNRALEQSIVVYLEKINDTEYRVSAVFKI